MEYRLKLNTFIMETAQTYGDCYVNDEKEMYHQRASKKAVFAHDIHRTAK